MKNSSPNDARKALRAALRLRTNHGIPLDAPLNIFDLSEAFGVEVRFVGGNSFEGMWIRESDCILVPTQRPRGRQVFACAHELGHAVFNHGTRVDILLDDPEVTSLESEELLVNLFAGFILMTPWAVKNAFAVRNWDLSSCTAAQIYTLACLFGVGYSTLVTHLSSSLRLITVSNAKRLLRKSPKLVRQELYSPSSETNLIVVDQQWTSVPIDLEVGEYLWLPKGTVLNSAILKTCEHTAAATIAMAVSPGVSRIASGDSDWASYVRISRKAFEGRSCYRHLEEFD